MIPTFNRAHCISDAVNSVLSQSHGCSEIIVVDDGSTDNTVSVLAAYGNAICVIRQENHGVSAARNAGIEAATGHWVAFLDSDDEWERDKLARQMAAVSRDRELVAHATNGWVHDANSDAPIDFFSTRSIASTAPVPVRADSALDWVLETAFMTPGVMVRRDVLRQIGGFDPSLSMFEDMDLLARVALRGPFGIDDTPLFHVYRRGPAGDSLSERCAARRGHAPRSLTRIYSKLLASPELSSVQRTLIRRRLSAQRADLAAVERGDGSWIRSACSFGRSVVDHPSVTSAARALAGLVAGGRAIDWMRRQRHRSEPAGFFRR